MSEEKIDFFSVPEEKAVIRPALEAKAKELGLIINIYMEHKIEWSETHSGRCMCDWEHRKCPCDEIAKDLIEYNGQCLCKVLVTEEKMKKIEKSQKAKKKKIKKTEKADKQKVKVSKELAKKLGCKKI